MGHRARDGRKDRHRNAGADPSNRQGSGLEQPTERAMSMHTPAPWIISANDNLIRANDDRHTVICNFAASLKNPAVMADAKLIAAAPDLLDALADAQEFVDRHSEPWYTSGQELLEKIR